MRTSMDDEEYIDEIRTSSHTDIRHLPDRSQGEGRARAPTSPTTGTTRLGIEDDRLDSLMAKYDDFHTIDWQRDLARDRLRHKYVLARASRNSWNKFSSWLDAASGWLCVLLVGISAGAIAGVIDIATTWLSDLKNGICADRFWLDREHCCWASDDETFAGEDCKDVSALIVVLFHAMQWVAWPAMMGIVQSSSAVLYASMSFTFYCGIAVSMAALCVTLVKVFAPYACGSGIPEIKCILSGFIIRGYLGKWTFVIKSVGLMLAAACGLNLGKEGPMVHLACCIGNIFSYMFPKYGSNEAKKREILSASAAAGVSVAFGAPIGGVMFSLEEASYYFPLKTLWRSFFCALIAGLILKMINPFGSSQTSLFYIDYEMHWTFMELIPFTLLGVIGGLVGGVFIYLNIEWCRYRKTFSKLGGHPILEVVIVTLLTSVLSFWNPYTRQSSSDLIRELFDRCGVEDESPLCDYSNRTYISVGTGGMSGVGTMGPGVKHAIVWMLIAFVGKLILTIFTFGMKVPAGLFVPSMAMGAIIGRIVGIVMEDAVLQYPYIFESCETGKECIMPGLYAMVGAAAVLGGVTRMTVSLVVIMFELTGSLQFIVPTMVAVMTAKWVGDALGKLGIYDAHIQLNAYPFLDNKEEFTHNTAAGQVMRPREGEAPLRTLSQDSMTVGAVEAMLEDCHVNGFPVLISQESQHLLGFVTRRDLKLAINNARKTQEGIVTQSIVYFTHHAPPVVDIGAASPLRLRKLMDLAPLTVTENTPMETVLDMFRKLGLRQCLVTHNGRLLGILTKKDALKHLHDMDDGHAIVQQS